MKDPSTFKWRADLKLDPKEVMDYIRSMGAPSIKEIKNEFQTNSAAVRKIVGLLLYKNKVWLLGHGSGVYVTENTGLKGNPSVSKLRAAAGVESGLGSRRRTVKRKPKAEPFDPQRAANLAGGRGIPVSGVVGLYDDEPR